MTNTNVKNGLLNDVRGLSAEAILEKYDLDNSIPVDITTLAKKLNVQLHSIDFSELNNTYKDTVKQKGIILGAVFHINDSIDIFYEKNPFSITEENKNDEIRKKELHRKRFTVAHELAHCCLHMSKGEPIHIEFRTDKMNLDNEKEKNANIFAGELLIPKKAIDLIYEKFELPTLESLSETFKVSKAVMMARLDYLGRPYSVNIT